MKVRYGFVSNSSSSSFVVHRPDETTAQIMREMLKIVKAEWKDEKFPKKMINAIDKSLKWLQSHPKKDIPLLYPNTCNYETWVYKTKGGDIFVDTCNNHDSNWENMTFDFRNEDDHDEDFEYLKTLKFLDLSDMKEKTRDEYDIAAYPEFYKAKKT